MANVPAAPSLPGEALIEIFVYPPSLAPNRPLEEGNKFSDSNRLLFLGRQVSQAVYMDVLRERWVHASGEQLEVLLLSHTSITRARSNRLTQMARIPPEPRLPGEALLEVFVYPGSLPPNRPLEPDNRFSDARRLEILGKSLVELVYMDIQRGRQPGANAQQLTVLVNSRIRGFMERTVAAYKWKDRVRGYPETFDRNSPQQESHRLFWTFAGAVHVAYSYEELKKWISALDVV
ncbi:hypothetical protein C8Q78DRAFT_1174447 [Trametes maxima]|nr:hypothetical protein C8Q78DRAFT_1174447 [Trametes maxima]